MTGSYTYAALKGFGDESYTTAALRGFGDDSYSTTTLRGFGDESYTDAALRGFGDGSYTDAALQGFGDESYTDAALRGFGDKAAAMNVLKSLQKANALSGKSGGSVIGALTKLYATGVGKWIKRLIDDGREQKAEINRLKGHGIVRDTTPKNSNGNPTAKPKPTSQRKAGKSAMLLDSLLQDARKKKIKGGKFDPRRDIIDFLAGPAGWIAMGVRKSREKEIEKLKKQKGVK